MSISQKMTKEKLIEKLPKLSPQEYAALAQEIDTLLTPEEVARYSTLEQMIAKSDAQMKAYRDFKKSLTKEDLIRMLPELSPRDCVALSDEIDRLLTQEEKVKYVSYEQNQAIIDDSLRRLEGMRATAAQLDAFKKVLPVKEIEKAMPADFMPVSSVMCRALAEECTKPMWLPVIINYLSEAQALWQDPKAREDAKSSWTIYLVEAYQKLEKKGIIDHDGVIRKPQEFATSSILNGSVCRPAGYTPVNLQETKEFKSLAKPSGIKIHVPQHGG